MTVSIQDQLRDYAAEVTSQSVPVDLDGIAFGDPPSQPVTQTVGAWPETPTKPMVPTRPRGWLVGLVAATAALVLLTSTEKRALRAIRLSEPITVIRPRATGEPACWPFRTSSPWNSRTCSSIG